MPPEMRDDTAFMDRIHAFLPGWDVPKINKELVTNHFGLVSDFLSECWSQLRNQSRVSELQNRVFLAVPCLAAIRMRSTRQSAAC